MDYNAVEYIDGDLYLTGIRHFDLRYTLDSGQAFRWREAENGRWEGVAHGRLLRLRMEGCDLVLEDTSPAEFAAVWQDYFDLGRDYGELFRRFGEDPVLRRAMEFAPGIRVLCQPPFEAVCSFILSQNNNIKRIKGLVERLCQLLGRPLGNGLYAFPAPEDIAPLTPDDLAPIRAGFRAKYLIDAARRVTGDQIDLQRLYTLPLAEARASLQTIHGVGPKVADCALLYGFGRVECIPMDVWMKRVMAHLYPAGFPNHLKPWGGIAQQTLFHYARCCETALLEHSR